MKHREIGIISYLNAPGELSLSDIQDFCQSCLDVPDLHLVLIPEEIANVFHRNFAQYDLETEYGILVAYQCLEPQKPITVLKALAKDLGDGR